jgi:hypothetical protein
VALQARGKQDSGVSLDGMIWKFDQSGYVLTPGATTPAGLAGKRPVTVRCSVDNERLPKHLTQTLGDQIWGPSSRASRYDFRSSSP